MAPEEKMLERFTREKQLRHKNSSAFDLDDEEMPGELTHMGQSLSLDGPALKDDFEEEDLELSDAEDHPSDDERQARKRRREELGEDEEDEDEDGEDRPERKKSKQEVMKELIAKSKLHKYERQAVKDDDEDLREELDKDLSNIHGLLRGFGPKPTVAALPVVAGMNPERAALLSGTDKILFDKEYDKRLKQLAQDQRAKPTEKSKPEEEVAMENARRLQELEAKRLRRMQGEVEDSDEEGKGNGKKKAVEQDDDEDDFGLGSGIKVRPTMEDLGIDDEDDFIIDDDLVASGSEMDNSDDDGSDESGDEDEDDEQDDEDDEFIRGLLTKEEASRPEFLTGANGPIQEIELPDENGVHGNLAYKFSCPQSHDEMLEVTKGIDVLDLPIVVQRIRLLHDPKLKSENKAKLVSFSAALVDHISFLANQADRPPFAVLEKLTRHIHSLAKTFPIEIANAFRRHLKDIESTRTMFPTPGDLVLLTAIGTVFPTSDHFHQVVTPAILTMGRYLGLKIPQNLSDFAVGAYLCTLCLQYQKLSKRYIPEVMNFIENSLCCLAPVKMAKVPGRFPLHEPKASLRITSAPKSSRGLAFYDCVAQELTEKGEESLKAALVDTNLRLLSAAADTWVEKSAFTEVFAPCLTISQHLASKKCSSKLSDSTQVRAIPTEHILTIQANTSSLPPFKKSLTTLIRTLTTHLTRARQTRRPLELHHHKPLAIKTHVPRFEENFNPSRHYDPDRERTEAAKLRKEHKREKKGAIRELRRDASILAVQSLREKKDRDAAYEKKYKRLVAEIQGEEGRESKQYEREKEWRKKGRK